MIAANPADMPARSDAEQLDFFEQALAASEAAIAAAGAIEHDMIVAGRRIRLRYAGDALSSVTLRALLPLCEAPSGEPDARFLLWDSASTAQTMPAPPLSNLCFSQRGDLWTFRSPRIRSAFHYWDYSLNLFDRERKLGIFWVQDAAALPSWTRAAPFRTLFHWCLADHGLQLVHGAVVGSDDGGVLICGPGGVGKSTTSLSALANGMSFVGDDYVVLSEGGPADTPLRAHALYASAKVHFADVERFRAIDPQAPTGPATGPDDKAVIYPQRGFVASLPLRAIVTPRFGAAEATSVERIDPDALAAAGSFPTRTQLPHSGLETIAFLERAVRAVPAGRLVLGRDRGIVPDALRALLRAPERAFAAAGEAPQPDDILVSVIVPAYNAAKYIGQTIADIRGQSHPAIELIVVDDGSTDETAAVVGRIDPPVRLIRQDNRGPAAARNRGIGEATGAFVTFQDADDLWPRAKIRAALAAFAEDPRRDVVIGHAQLFETDAAGGMAFVASPLDTFPWSISAATFRRAIFETVGGFDPLLRFGEDTDWFDKARHGGAIVHRLQDIGLLVRRHETNSTKGKSIQDIYPVRLLHNRLMRQREAKSPLEIEGAALCD